MLFSVFYVGDYCQGWGREFESPFPLQILKKPWSKDGAFFMLMLFSLNDSFIFISLNKKFLMYFLIL